ncbi:MAG: hypothetical protein PHI06_11020 [Desulfobulbaceae bacterium]|nr:hypothetical protein [Desulfobulbaceae bacterium]
MKKSEKIILSLVFVAAIYAAVDFSTSRSKKGATPDTTQADSQSLTELNAQVSSLSSDSNKKVDRLAATINETWSEETFVHQQLAFGDKEADADKDIILNDLQAQVNQLQYTGFLAMGSEMIAIINGMDYRIGEQVNGFTVSKITHGAIQLTQKDATFTVPAITEKLDIDNAQ